MKWRSLLFLMVTLSSLFCTTIAQNVVGLIDIDSSKSFYGYNLLFPQFHPNAYLLNQCGEVVQVWEDSSNIRPGNISYLLQNGNLLMTKVDENVSEDPIWAGGGGEFIEIRSWDNELLWQYSLSDSTARLHHDVEPMPNGNILAIAWEYVPLSEVVEAGRNTFNLKKNFLWPDMILEIQPNIYDTSNPYEIVWEWHSWDHLIQDFDSSKSNFGIIKDHPERINVNYDNTEGSADWLHMNSIYYNEDLDHILLSVPTFNEIWMIDHSTTTEEAASHVGGNTGKGGDLIYRWGNPRAYHKGDSTDQKLFFQHDAHWIESELSGNDPDVGKVLLFNNQVNDSTSTVNILLPEWDEENKEYLMLNGVYLPSAFDWTYTPNNTWDMYSRFVSSAQRLPNGNTLICAGNRGRNFEITSNGEVVWEYKTPLIQGMPVAQGTEITDEIDNFTFRMKRYPSNYSGLIGKDLSSIGFIELNPDLEYCNKLLSTEKVMGSSDHTFSVWPLPCNDELYVVSENNLIQQIELLSTEGTLLFKEEGLNNSMYMLGQKVIIRLAAGVYYLCINGESTQKIIKL